jgi:hypothetical protein
MLVISYDEAILRFSVIVLLSNPNQEAGGGEI